MPNIQIHGAGNADAGASAAGRLKELERSLLWEEEDLLDMKTEIRTLRTKELQLLDMHKSLDGQVADWGQSFVLLKQSWRI